MSPNIDRNYLDVAAGTPHAPLGCATVDLDFTAYPALVSGATSDLVRAARCLLESAGYQPGAGDPCGVVDEGIHAATRAFQQECAAGEWHDRLAYLDRPASHVTRQPCAPAPP